MTKRMTLLAKREGMSTSDFRNYWAGPHARLALGMPGITKYVQNRLDKVLWTSREAPAFKVDGVAELSFADAQSMQAAQACAVGRKYIPADEPNFLRGWTLCVMEPDEGESAPRGVKVLVPFHARPEARDALWTDLCRVSEMDGWTVALNWTASTARRPKLWSEPMPPTGFVSVGVDSVANAHDAFDHPSALAIALETHTSSAVAFLVDELIIR